jgi:hypothetical protein
MDIPGRRTRARCDVEGCCNCRVIHDVEVPDTTRPVVPVRLLPPGLYR